MNTYDALQTALLDLLWELQNTGINLIIGGGYGIFLKTKYIKDSHFRTLLTELPEARSTNDIDLFLRPEFLIKPMMLQPLSIALSTLGYQVIETAKNYQFVKTGPGNIGSIKIDLLTGPAERFTGTPVKADDRRAHPNPSVGLHAHPVNEALTLEEGLLPVRIAGILSTGRAWDTEVFLPNPFSFLLMKLFAFRDRTNDESKEFGRYHALDLYSIIATTTEVEWENLLKLRDKAQTNTAFTEAKAIIREYFSEIDQTGMLRLRESRYYRPEMQLGEFIGILKEIFGVKLVLR